MKVVFRITLILFAFSTLPAKAVVCTDPTSYAQLLIQYYEDIQQWAEEKLQLEAMRQLQKKISDFQTSMQRQNSANDIARTTEVSTQIHNREMDAMLAPVPGICGFIESSENIKDADSTSNQSKKEIAKTYVNKRVRNINEKAYITEKNEEVDTLLSHLYRLDESTPGETLPIRADVFFGANGNTYSDEEYEASGMYIDLLMSEHKLAKPPKKPDTSIASARSKAQYIDYLSDVSHNLMIRNSLEAIRAERAPAIDLGGGEKISHLGLMEKFVKGKWGGSDASEFIAIVTNTHENKEADPNNYLTSASQVLRIIAGMEAFSLYNQQKRTEQQLRVEGLEVLQTIYLKKISEK